MLYLRALLVPALIALAAVGASLAEGRAAKDGKTVVHGTVDTTGQRVVAHMEAGPSM